MRIDLNEAAESLKNGQVLAVPTETVYGLAAPLNLENSIAKIFSLKGRPSDNPLIIHVSSVKQIAALALTLPPNFYKLAFAFWPGALTVVLNVDVSAVPSAVRAGLDTAAFGIPSHPLALKLIDQVGPLVMPSANISGRPSATAPEHIEADFGKEFPILDGGRCERGVESTIVIYVDSRWRIIRLGSLPAESFLPVLGYVPTFQNKEDGAHPLCPGQMYRHYAPSAKLLLTKKFEEDFSGIIVGFSDRTYPLGAQLLALGPLARPDEVAENLYFVLRELDARGITLAHVDINFPKNGLWVTISERLNKASYRSSKDEN